MNGLRNTLKLAAVTLTVAAGCSWAEGLKAEIPFAFKAGNAVMQPGTYRILEKGNGARYIQLVNGETRHSVLLVPANLADPPKDWRGTEQPKLAFLCGDGRCSLQQVWYGEGPAYRFHMPAFGKDTKTQIAVIVMHRDSE
jgi:hypothetical protein